MATQQEVIKKFMASLDTTSKSGTAALDEAVDYATKGTSRHFSTIAEAIAAMKADINSTNNADTFLKDFCGINLDNTDTGAITGADAGGSTTKTAKSIVSESGQLKTYASNSIYLEKYGITIYLSKIESDGRVNQKPVNGVEVPNLSFDDLTDKQKYIWKGLYTWWASGALDLIAESYGSNFGFTSSSLITPKRIYFGFYDRSDSSNAESGPLSFADSTKKETTALVFRVNMNKFGSIDTSDSNGVNSSGEYLDRTLAHEFTHCVMAANINYYNFLPQFIKEGVAELTIGGDDGSLNKSYMKQLADKSSLTATGSSKSLLDTALDLSNTSTGQATAYAGGYMFLRYLAKQATESVPVSFTEGNDNYNNSISGVTLNALGGNDSITNSGADTSIFGGSGNDTIRNYAEKSTLAGGTGDDSIQNGSNGNKVLINSDDGKNVIDNAGSNVTINGGSNSDKIFSWSNGKSVIISSGNGDDTIYTHGSNNTINGGKGNDYIWNNATQGTNVLFTYINGDGNDTIVGFNANSTLSISGAAFSKTKSSDNTDWLIKVGNNTITLQGAASLTSPNIVSDSSAFTEGDDTYNNSVSGVSLNALGGNDSIYNTGSKVTIDGGAGNDSIANRGNNVTMLGGAGNDTLYSDKRTGGDRISIDGGADNDVIINYGINSTLLGGDGDDTINNYKNGYNNKNELVISDGGENVTINGGADNDSIYNTGNYVTISGGDGADSIVNGGSQVTILGGKGNDLISLGSDSTNNVIQFSAGDGNDTITGFNATSTLSIGNGKGEYSSVMSGKDMIVTVGDSNIALKSVDSLKVNIDGKEIISTTVKFANADNANQTLAAKIITADATARTKAIKLTGNALDNSILGGSSKDSLYGADGNDYLSGGKGNDKLYGQNGDDTLWGGAGNDSLKGGDGADVFIYNAGNDVITDYTEDSDKISISAAISKTSVKGSDATFTIGKNTLTVKDGFGKEIVFIDAKGKERTIIGGAYLADNSSSSKSTLSAWREVGDASARTKAIKLTGNALDNSILGGSGKDSLYGDAGDDYLFGGKGNDKLYGQDGNDTLWGGIGNDTLKGGDGADVFIYESGDGKDVINGFENNDMLLITGAFSASYDAKKKTIAFKVDSTDSAITIKDFTATKFNINGINYKISGSKLVKK